MLKRRAGFTLTELLVVVIIMGILAALAVPGYLKTVEASKADDAVAQVNMIATTNKMYALDHGGTYVAGTFGSSPCASGSVTCPTSNAAQSDACVLVACKYLADQPWSTKPYYYGACNPSAGACTVDGQSMGTNPLAGAKRHGGTGSYAAYYYSVEKTGVINNGGGAPSPVY